MNHDDHVRLLERGVLSRGGVWADLGSGRGAFTLALADLIGPGGEIYSVDRDRSALADQRAAMSSRFPDVVVHYLGADFTAKLDLPFLDGIVMANSLHFHRRKDEIMGQVRTYLRREGRLILVEYDVDIGNPWVPWPISFESWQQTARRSGFRNTILLATVPSRFLRQIYSAANW